MVPNPKGLVREFESKHSVYEQFCGRMRDLFAQLLSANSIPTHSITCRTKTAKSLLGKLRKPDKDYTSLDDVTDLVGLRITVYFEDQVDAVERVVRSEFLVHDDKSVDKRKRSDPTVFGYSSLHLICEVAPQRVALREYCLFKGLLLEVQIRSVLQHAWAEIEHDLGYKSELAVPAHLRRRFSRVAALLELADSEFIQVRDALAEYSRAVVDRVATAPESVEIDAASVRAFVERSADVERLVKAIAEKGGVGIKQTTPAYIELVVKLLRSGGVPTIDQLSRLLSDNSDVVLARGRSVRFGVPTIDSSLPLFYLGQFLIASFPTEKETSAAFDGIPIGNEEFAKRIRAFVAEHPLNLRALKSR